MRAGARRRPGAHAGARTQARRRRCGRTHVGARRRTRRRAIFNARFFNVRVEILLQKKSKSTAEKLVNNRKKIFIFYLFFLKITVFLSIFTPFLTVLFWLGF